MKVVATMQTLMMPNRSGGVVAVRGRRFWSIILKTTGVQDEII